MFFSRLRRHAKWMFVLLAVFMGGGFVIFGVGAGGVGVGDVFRGGGGGSGSPSIEKALEATTKNPKDAQAWRDLSTAYQTEADTDQAVVALATAASLLPKDVDIQRELASLYLQQASDKQTEAQLAQLEAANGAATWNFPGALTTGTGTSPNYVLQDPIGKAINALAATKTNEAYQAASQAASYAVESYRTIARLLPRDPNVQLELASTAEQVGDTATAIAAYERFLKLAPDDPNVSIVKQQLKQLKGSSAVASG
jgi:Flp pilus assembly protein TadD